MKTLLLTLLLLGSEISLYNSLDPQSLTQHLAFYELYPNTLEGKKALNHAWKLLGQENETGRIALPASSVSSLIQLINKAPGQELPTLSKEELIVINRISDHLSNRFLKGYLATSEEEVLQLPTEEIDLARALFLSSDVEKRENFEAMIDLMALQVLMRVDKNASQEEKIRAISELIFDEMGFRFPPHSLYAKDIDLYTFLPSVLDSRRGVCLGVSILYLTIAQRLGLELEAVTPPGHIYVRFKKDDKEINIETTARGVHIDSEEYLGIDTRSLQVRTLKEVVGFAHINHASVFLGQGDFENAKKSYLKAIQYIDEDKLVQELLAFSQIFTGDNSGKERLMKIRNVIPDHAVSKGTLIDDYLDGNIDEEGIKPIFLHVDEKRESIVAKRRELEKTLRRYPKFRDGWQALGVTWLQLHRAKEGLEALEEYHKLDPSNPEIEYYLAMLYASRDNYPAAWKHLQNAEKITAARDHSPKALKQLRKELSIKYPQ